MAELTIVGHLNEWVALIGKKIVASSPLFEDLVKKLQNKKLLNKATVTYVSGSYGVHKRC